MRCDVLGIEFDKISQTDAVSRAVSFLGDQRPHYIVTPNAEIVYLCRDNPDARYAVAQADLVLPDGVGILKASRILGRPIAERVSGIDFATALLPELAALRKPLFLLGARSGVACEAAEKLRAAHPGLIICGARDGYFSDSEAVIAEIRESGAEVVFVCLGAPKQELWMQQHIGDTGARLLVGLGGSFDVWAGHIKRAPKLFIKLGLEWLYRLLRQPKRLLRVWRLPAFLRAVRRQKREEDRNAAGR